MKPWASLAAGLGLATGVAGMAVSAEPAHPALRGLSACAEVADPGQRATCYDAALATLNSAVRTGEVLIVQRKEAQAAQRSAFGLNLPALAIFDGTGKDAAPLENVTGEAKRAYRDQFGKWVVELADGAVWRQIDSETISPAPRAGSQVEIRKAALGSFFMKVDGQRGVRAKRSD